jgi:hypothetical protein
VNSLDPVEHWLWRTLLCLMLTLILTQSALSLSVVRDILLPIARFEGRALR